VKISHCLCWVLRWEMGLGGGNGRLSVWDLRMACRIDGVVVCAEVSRGSMTQVTGHKSRVKDPLVHLSGPQSRAPPGSPAGTLHMYPPPLSSLSPPPHVL